MPSSDFNKIGLELKLHIIEFSIKCLKINREREKKTSKKIVLWEVDILFIYTHTKLVQKIKTIAQLVPEKNEVL